MRQGRDIDLIVGEQPRVMGETEPIQEATDVIGHGAFPQSATWIT